LSATAVLDELRARHVDVSRRGDGLRLRGPQDAVDGDLVGRVRRHKAEILTWLDEVDRILDMPISVFERQQSALELRVGWWHETLWLVPTAKLANALSGQGVSAGRIWRAQELAQFLSMPGLTPDDIGRIGKLRATFGAEIVAVSDGHVSPVPPAIGGSSAVARRCQSCRGRRFWRSVYDVTICATCHPPAAPDLVAAWIEPGA
jgi:hypothetical protein